MPHEVDLDKDIAVGVTLPIRNSNSGMFNQSMTTLEAASSNIKNLLLTMKGERPMQPNFGCDLFSQLFEPMVDGGEIEERAQISIQEAIDTWLPYIHIEEMDFTATEDDKNNNIFRINLLFSIKSDPNRFEQLTFTIQGETGE
tara:strand:+ start:159 stop:587 length:429 start_codon:yes stop_codon:yes gene_type:complete